jgi:hypothetical protein
VADIGLIRKRLRAEIDAARRAAGLRRERTAAASRAYEVFLTDVAVPAFRAVAAVLRAEGMPFDVQTPSDGVRLVSDRHRDDGIELELDTSTDPPQVMLLTTRGRGSRIVRTERRLAEGAAIEAVTEDEVLERLIEDLRPWLG